MINVVRIQSRICVGGPALNSILLSQGLSSPHHDRYQTHLLGGELEPGERSMSTFAEARGVKVNIIPHMHRPVSPKLDAQALRYLVGYLRKVRPTIVHTHTAKAGAIGRTAARLAGVPLVVHTFHGHVFDGYFSPKKAQAFIKVEQGLAKVTDQILAISEQQKEDLVFKYRIAPAEKVRVIPLGIELERFVEVDRAQKGSLRGELGIPEDAPLVATVGRLVPIKRFDLLIEAFQGVLKSLPDAHLVIAGDGELRAELEAQARPIRERVHFLGWRDDAQVIYQAADCFALTSDNEGTPVAVIEALTAGLPVVATRVGGVEDVLFPGAGQVVEPKDVSAIERAIEARLTNPEQLTQQQRSKVFRRYSHRRLIADMGALYDQLCEERPRPLSRSLRALWRGV